MANVTAEQIEAKARDLYEEARKRVRGRPAWENMDLTDAYDMGMRSHAFEEASKALGG